MQQKEELAELSKFKEYLIQNNFPENLPDYDTESYWDARYELEQQDFYDWYIAPATLKQLISEFVDPHYRILQVGSGKSSILDSFYKWGYKNLIGSDFSWTLINQKKSEQRYLKRGIRWQRIDITKQWPNFQVDCIFEKATLDCLSPGDLKKTINLIHKNLKQKGIFFHISCFAPENRINVLKKWEVKVYEFPKTIIPAFTEIDNNQPYYVYACIK